MVDILGELSQLTTDATKSPAAAAANKNYDKFVWLDGSTPRCTRGPAWSSDTARGTGAGTSEVTRLNGVLVNANDITNGPLANKGTLVGSIRTNASALVDWQYGFSAAGGGQALFGVSNLYRRRPVRTAVYDLVSASHGYVGTWRAFGGSSTYRASFIRCVDEDEFSASFSAYCDSPIDGGSLVGVGLDGANPVLAGSFYEGSTYNSSFIAITGRYFGAPGLGWHYLGGMQMGGGSVNSNWYANSAGAAIAHLTLEGMF
jgi:hypothetical protein